jgi:hypothetical protein
VLRPYLALTAHWIAENKKMGALQLKSALIGFHCVRGNHTGKVLAQTVLYLLDRAEITMKVCIHFNIDAKGANSALHQLGWLTLDNASNNKTVMEELAKRLAIRDIPFHLAHRRIMCFPHIINICTQHILEAFSKSNPQELHAMFAAEDLFLDPAEKDRYLAAVIRRPSNLGQETIHSICASGLRRDQFADMVKAGNARGWVHDLAGHPIQVPQKELIHDVVTRWDSTYYMLNCLRILRPVSPRHPDSIKLVN